MKKITATALTFLFLTVATARGQDAMEFYNKGLNCSLAYKRIAYFTQAIQADPGLTVAFEGRALEYYFQRRFDKAIQDYNRVIAAKPLDANLFLQRGASYLKKEKGSGYRAEFDKLVSHYKNGRKPNPSELLDRAIEDLNRAIELNPELASAYSYRAEAYRIKGMTEEALDDAARAIQMEGDQRSIAMAYATRSKIYGKLDQNELSEANYLKSIELSPFTADFPPLNVPILFHDTYDTANLKSARHVGLLGIIAIAFVLIFKLAIPTPTKKE